MYPRKKNLRTTDQKSRDITLPNGCKLSKWFSTVKLQFEHRDWYKAFKDGSRVIGHRWPETKSFWLHAHKGKDRGGKTMSKFNGASKRYLWSQVRLNYKYTHSRNVTKKSLTFKHTQCLESSDEERSPGKIFASIECRRKSAKKIKPAEQ